MIEGDRLYGRGGADDGYAAFASLAAVEAVQRAGGAHARCVVLIEASEESGSPDLPAHLEALGDRIGTPSLVLCLDSGCATTTTSGPRRRCAAWPAAPSSVEILGEGAHSGAASGVIPSSFRIARQLLDRVEDAATGEVRLPELHVTIPPTASVKPKARPAPRPSTRRTSASCPGLDPPRMIRSSSSCATTGGRRCRSSVPTASRPTTRAGNVLRPQTALQLSFRLPPTCDADAALAAVEATLTADPPYGARVTFTGREAGQGWNAPPFATWLDAALEDASQTVCGAPYRAFGEGGTIPFMGMLGLQYPEAQFVITGVLGPESNAHGPNEFLHLPTGERVTAALAMVLDHHARRCV